MKQLWQKRKQRLTEAVGADAYTAALNSEWKEILPWLPLRTLLRRWGSMYPIHSNTMYLYLKFRNEHIHPFFVGNWLHEMTLLTTLFNSTAVFKIVSIFHKTIFFQQAAVKTRVNTTWVFIFIPMYCTYRLTGCSHRMCSKTAWQKLLHVFIQFRHPKNMTLTTWSWKSVRCDATAKYILLTHVYYCTNVWCRYDGLMF